jgi:hypothetical protein
MYERCRCYMAHDDLMVGGRMVGGKAHHNDPSHTKLERVNALSLCHKIPWPAVAETTSCNHTSVVAVRAQILACGRKATCTQRSA